MFTFRMTVAMVLSVFLACQVMVSNSTLKGQTQKSKAKTETDILQLPRQSLFPVLCQVTALFTEDDVVSKPDFLESRGIPGSNISTIHLVKQLIQLRRLDVLRCCKSDSQHQTLRCLVNIRRRRIDHLCSSETSSGLPFKSSRQAFMVNRINHCCFKLGVARYHCFNDSSKHYSSVLNQEFSLDETDPINDMWDFPVNSTWVLEMTRIHGGKLMSLQSGSSSIDEHHHYQKRRHLKQADDYHTRGLGNPPDNQQPQFNKDLYRERTSSQQMGTVQASEPRMNQTQEQTTTLPPRTKVVDKILSSSAPIIRSRVGTMKEINVNPTHDGVLTAKKSIYLQRKEIVADLTSEHFRHPGAVVEGVRHKIGLTRSTTRPTTATTITTTTTTTTQIVTTTPPVATISSASVVTETLDKGSLRKSPSLKMSDIASIQERWWVRNPQTLRNSLLSHERVKTIGKTTKGSMNPPIPQSYKQGPHRSRPRNGNIPDRISESKRPVIRKSGGRVNRKRARGKVRHRKPARKHNRKSVKTRHVKGGRENVTLEKQKNCTYSVLRVDDIRDNDKTLSQMLRRKYKHDTWD